MNKNQKVNTNKVSTINIKCPVPNRLEFTTHRLADEIRERQMEQAKQDHKDICAMFTAAMSCRAWGRAS